MKIERTKNAVRNIISGTFLKIYQIIMPFIMRTIMIYVLGIEYTGLNGLFTSILQVLNLAELGVGSAMTFAMYKPIAENDSKTINALMKLYRSYYRAIGGLILVIGLIITPFIPHIISGDIPHDINLSVLYYMNLGATVLSYWLFAYRNSILQAFQRLDLTNKVTIVTDTCKYILQILTLLLFKSYYIFVTIMLLSQALTNILTAYVSYKTFPEYKAEGILDRLTLSSINHKIRDLFTAKIGGVIVNSADTIVVSAFMGLKYVAIYQNYNFVLTAVIGLLAIVFNSCMAGIGNSLITESKEKNYGDLKRFTFIIAFLINVCASCLLGLYQPFMELWVGKDLMLHFSLVCCFVLYFVVYEFNSLLNTFKDAAGMWHEDRFRPLITALSNLGLNLLSVKYLGLYGIILSTIVSFLFIGIPWIMNNIFSTIFEKNNMKQYLRMVSILFSEIALFSVISYGICYVVPVVGFAALLINGLICVIIPTALFIFFNKSSPEFLYMLEIFNRITKGRLFDFKAIEKYYNKVKKTD